MNVYKKKFISFSLLLIAMAVVFGGAVFAASSAVQGSLIKEVQRVQLLIEQKSFAQAEKEANAYLAQDPDSPQMRLLYGVALAKQGKDTSALLVFQALVKSNPELPEAYNNVAALHAEGKQYSKAREALEQGIATNPTYERIHENLGVIYARFAKEAYENALLIPPAESKNADLSLALDRSPVVLIDQVESTVPTKGQPVELPSVVIQVEPKLVAQAQSKTVKLPAVNASTVAADKAVEAAVENWAKAWESQDLKAYFSSYGPGFKPAKGRSRSAWEAFRRSRIENKSKIRVSINNLKITVNGDKAQAKFTQRYRAGSFRATGRKTLDFVLSNGSWLIVSEKIN